MQDLLEGADDAPLQPLVGDGHLAHLRLHRPELCAHRLDTRLHPTNPLVESARDAHGAGASGEPRRGGELSPGLPLGPTRIVVERS